MLLKVQVAVVATPVTVITRPVNATVEPADVVHELAVIAPAVAVTTYPTIADPPFDAGAVQLTVTTFPVATEAVTPVGTPGVDGLVKVAVPATLE